MDMRHKGSMIAAAAAAVPWTSLPPWSASRCAACWHDLTASAALLASLTAVSCRSWYLLRLERIHCSWQPEIQSAPCCPHCCSSPRSWANSLALAAARTSHPRYGASSCGCHRWACCSCRLWPSPAAASIAWALSWTTPLRLFARPTHSAADPCPAAGCAAWTAFAAWAGTCSSGARSCV